MSATFVIEAGSVFSVPYPFVRDVYNSLEEDGPVEVPTWKPGVRYVAVGPEDSEAVADAAGRMILRVVDVFKPAHYPARVFYTRQWEDPKGRVFGKKGLRIVTLEKFRRLARGYQHEFRIDGTGKEGATLRHSALAEARKTFYAELNRPVSRARAEDEWRTEHDGVRGDRGTGGAGDLQG